MRYYYLLTGACTLICGSFFAQSTSPTVCSTAGTTYLNGSASLEQTIGEPLTTTYNPSSNALTQGFQQPVLTFVGIAEWEQAQVQLFPNPTQDQATVRVPSLMYTHYRIYDAAGKLIAENDFSGEQFSFSIQNYESGSYHLSLQGTIETVLTFIKL